VRESREHSLGLCEPLCGIEALHSEIDRLNLKELHSFG
jgi:hypothetical protein